jgi:hypothetical protein
MEADFRVNAEGQSIARFEVGTPVTIPPEGHPIPFGWTAVAGATGAEVSAAGLRIGPSTTQRSLGDLKTAEDGGRYVVTTGGKRIHSLKLNGLKYLPEGAEEEVALSSTAGIPGGFHLVVEIPNPDGGWLPPLHAVPPASRQGMIPETLTGASFEDGVLRLPDLVASRIRLTFAKGAAANEFERQDFTLGTVEGTETVVPKDLRVVGPDGAVAWAFPGDFPPTAPVAEVDLRLPLQTALTGAVKAGQPPEATFRIEGSGTISLIVRSAHGALVRDTPGVVRTVLAGDEITLGDGTTLPGEAPSSATADLTVRYDGIRLLETVSDPAPAPGGPSAGLVVTAAGAVRELPPQALEGRIVRRLGLFGRAAVEAEIEVGLVDAVSGAALTPSGALSVAPSGAFATHWVELPPHDPIARPANLSVRAGTGRFLWVAEGHPLAKVAIDDPSWPGREVSLGGIPLAVPPGVPESHQPGAALPTAAFVAASPSLQSDLFLTIDVGDLVLRYAR